MKDIIVTLTIWGVFVAAAVAVIAVSVVHFGPLATGITAWIIIMVISVWSYCGPDPT
jgi:uncharacterized membrane protein YgaE (UPF0421/DUF939 family)